MVVYEKGDDFGNDSSTPFASSWWGSGCYEIACCNVQQFAVVLTLQDVDNIEEAKKEGSGRGLDDLHGDVELLTVDEFRALFGEEPDESDFL